MAESPRVGTTRPLVVRRSVLPRRMAVVIALTERGRGRTRAGGTAAPVVGGVVVGPAGQPERIGAVRLVVAR